MKTVVLALICWLSAVSAWADQLTLKPDFPDRYVVKKGDTLWDISALYLNSPWKWPRLWQHNPQIDNPHLIYPGDVLTLTFIDGEPRLVRKPMLHMSPTSRLKPKEQPIPTLPLSVLAPFLSRDHVIDSDLLEGLPYVLGDNDAQTRIAIGRPVYTRGEVEQEGYYGVYRVGDPYVDPETSEVLGHAVTFLAIGQVVGQHHDQISEFRIIDIRQEMRQGDILLPLPEQDQLPVYFSPRQKDLSSDGLIVASANDNSVFSRYDVVLINKGARDSIEAGDMFSIAQPGKLIVDKPARKSYQESANAFDRLFNDDQQLVALPREKVGELMVFKVYDKLSFAIITESKIIMYPQFLVESL